MITYDAFELSRSGIHTGGVLVTIVLSAGTEVRRTTPVKRITHPANLTLATVKAALDREDDVDVHITAIMMVVSRYLVMYKKT